MFLDQTEEQNDNLEIDNSTCILPVIDNVKRKNFLKLSLSKTTINISNDMSKNPKIKNNANTPGNNQLTGGSTNDVHSSLPKRKHISLLSLTKKTRQNMNNVSTNTDLSQFNQSQNFTICFEPGRNSTVVDNRIIEESTENSRSKESAEYKNLNENKLLRQDVESKTINLKHDNKGHFQPPSQNLANKSEEIVNLLNSLDDDKTEETNENNKNNEESQKRIEPPVPTKFFHSRKENLHGDISLKDLPNPKFKNPNKNYYVKKKKNLSKKRSSLKNKNDIYEFLSQSQTSDSEGGKPTDPTADIIKKLIDQGKVRVATNAKGKGKPIFKRRLPRKQMKPIKHPTVKNPTPLKNKIKTVTIAKNVIEQHFEEDDHFQDHFDGHFDQDLDDDCFSENVCSVEEGVNEENRLKKLNNYSRNDQEGTFSRLAKTVLINQAGHSDLQSKKKALHVLKMVKQFISTPKNKQPMSETTIHLDFSPISMPPPRRATMASPWRVNEDAHLPRSFNFSRSSANLPSYSSDFIPSTPRKAKSKHTHKEMLQKECNVSSENISLPAVSCQSPRSDNSELSKHHSENESSRIISSFSSNDSNAENIAPPDKAQEGNNENNNIFDLKQFPNPRRALSYRSPLKTINILEVVHLPPYKPTLKPISSKGVNNVERSNCDHKAYTANDSSQPIGKILDVRKSSQKTCTEKGNSIEQDHFDNEENVTEIEKPSQKMYAEENNNSIGQDLFHFHDNADDDNSLAIDVTDGRESSKVKKIVGANNAAEQYLFGFEEFLSQTHVSSQEDISTNDLISSSTETNETIQELRKLKPQDDVLVNEKLVCQGKKIALLEDESNELGGNAKRQRDIKEMLCSTMIHSPQPSTSKEALKDLRKRNLKCSRRSNIEDNCNISELFKDTEPKTTFNENVSKFLIIV